MNIATKAYLVFLLLFTNIYTTNKYYYNTSEIYYYNVNTNNNTISKAAETLSDCYKDLVKALAFKESSNNWKAYNSTSKAIGKYQFTKSALKQVGLNISYNDFILNPNIWPEKEQDKAMIKLINHNKKTLYKYIKKYKGTKINNIEISEHNLIAAAHLAGAQGVINFLDTTGSYNPSDGHTKISDYLAYFK